MMGEPASEEDLRWDRYIGHKDQVSTEAPRSPAARNTVVIANSMTTENLLSSISHDHHDDHDNMTTGGHHDIMGNGTDQHSLTASITLPEYKGSRSPSVKSSTSIGIGTLDGGRYDAFSRISLTWKDVAVQLHTKQSRGFCKGSDDKSLNILKGVSGLAEPGQFIAIMGASGAGKTTLLNTLAFRNEAKLKYSGDIRVNGLPIGGSQMKLISAYVQQEDYFVGTLTVYEVMMFHANLRMDKHISMNEKKKKVEATLTALGLQKVKDSLVGLPDGSIRGISGGEKKRLSVATELLMDPPLLFIDEPTSGLDSFMAESIVRLIRKLAKANRTILCTIHQPTSEVFALFDRVCLVAEGEMVFIGPSNEARDFFSDAGYPCPRDFNPADHYIFTLAIRPGEDEKCKEKCKKITSYYRASQYHKNVMDKIASLNEDADQSTKHLSREKVQSPLWRQVTENFKRSFLNTVRNPGYTRSRIGQCLVIALLAGLAYFNISNTIDPANGEYLSTVSQNKAGVLYFIVISLTFGTVFIQCLAIPMELPVVRREYQNGMYSTVPYFISKIVTEIPFLIMLPLIQISISYFMIGLREDVGAFFTCVAGCIFVSWGSTGLGWFIAAWTGDLRIASAVAAPIIMPFFLFGGLFQSQDSTPVYFYPFKWTSWFRYGYSMLMVNELKDLELDCIDFSPCPNGTAILEQFGLDPTELWWPNVFALFMFGAILAMFGWSCLLCRVRR